MNKSIINNNKCKCYLCGTEAETEIFYCIPNKTEKNIEKAKEDGLYVYLCKKHKTYFGKIETVGCIDFVEKDPSFKRMLIGIGEDHWREVHKGLRKDFEYRYGK